MVSFSISSKGKNNVVVGIHRALGIQKPQSTFLFGLASAVSVVMMPPFRLSCLCARAFDHFTLFFTSLLLLDSLYICIPEGLCSLESLSPTIENLANGGQGAWVLLVPLPLPLPLLVLMLSLSLK